MYGSDRQNAVAREREADAAWLRSLRTMTGPELRAERHRCDEADARAARNPGTSWRTTAVAREQLRRKAARR